MQDLIHKATELPWAGLLPVGAVFLVGLILWVAGRPVLRPVFTVIGLIAGGLIGVEVGLLPQLEAFSVPLWAFGVAGAVVAALLAALAYRMLLALSICGLFGALAPLLLWTAVDLRIVHIEGSEAGDEPAMQEVLARAQDAAGTEAAIEAAPPPAETANAAQPATPAGPQAAAPAGAAPEIAAAPSATPDGATATGSDVPADAAAAEAPAEWKRWAKDTVFYVSQRSRTAWTESAAPVRWALMAAAAVGALLGLIVGAAAPSFSASVVTALGGALLLIGAGCTAAARLHLPPGLLPTSAMAWLAWWIVAAVIGLGLQWIFRPKPADK